MAILGTDRKELGYKKEEGTIELRAFVESTIVSESPDIDRITRYQLFWNFYHGKHWRMYNETLLSYNYARAFVDKINNFLVGKKGFVFSIVSDSNEQVPEEVEKAVEGFIDFHWKKNKKVALVQEMLQMGSVTGDLWVHLGWEKEQEFVTISVLDSRHCFPVFENGDVNKLEKFVLRQPLQKNSNDYRVYVIEYTDSKIVSWYQKETNIDGKRFEEREAKNTLDTIPIIHIKNRPTSDGYYSRSDLSDIIKLNKTYNELSNEIKSIIDYYGTPTTVITGGTVKTLRKGLGNIWSGLPPEANVFNLGLGEDLNANITFLKELKNSMHELMDVPENAMGKLQAISNTSAAALQITYQPLIQQADVKWVTYGDGISEINKMITKIVRKVDPSNKLLKKCPKDFEKDLSVEPVFTYGLPQDRASELNQANLELTMKVASRREIMNRLGKKNVPDLLNEINEDLALLNSLNSSMNPQDEPTDDNELSDEVNKNSDNFNEE